MNTGLGELDVQEFEIDLLDSGGVSVEAPSGVTVVTTSSWLCVTATIVSVSATAYYGCVGA